MKKPRYIIYLYEGATSIQKIHNPANYSLSRLMMESEKLECPVLFFHKSDHRESYKNLQIIPFSFFNLFSKLIQIGISSEVILISTSKGFDKLACNIKKIFRYKILIRRAGIYYGKKFIEENCNKLSAENIHLKNIDAFISTADGTPVFSYTDALKIPRYKVRSWLNGIPEIPNKNQYQRQNQVVCISRLSSEKCVDYVIKSFAKAFPLLNTPHNLIIVGDGPEEDKLKKLTKELNIEKNVLFVGYSDDVEKWLYSSKVLLTGLANNTILEAIATSTYTISVELGELKYNYRDFKNLFFIPYEHGGYGKINEKELDQIIQGTVERLVDLLNNYKESPLNKIDYSIYGWDIRLNKERQLYQDLVNEKIQ